MKDSITYLWYVLRHKWFVILAGCEIRANLWQLIIHDMSKLHPFEFKAYRDWFTTGRRDLTAKERFQHAWLHHVHHNPHHWEYWLLHDRYTSALPLNIPERYIREMVADWMAMGRMFGNTACEWYAIHRDDIILHPNSRKRIECLIGYRDHL